MGSVRLSALSRFGVLYIMTHDSIGLGEDGPTHQPVEMLECLRALPNFLTIRPADGNETVGGYIAAMEHPATPTCLSLSRQATPTVEGDKDDNETLCITTRLHITLTLTLLIDAHDTDTPY